MIDYTMIEYEAAKDYSLSWSANRVPWRSCVGRGQLAADGRSRIRTHGAGNGEGTAMQNFHDKSATMGDLGISHHASVGGTTVQPDSASTKGLHLSRLGCSNDIDR